MNAFLSKSRYSQNQIYEKVKRHFFLVLKVELLVRIQIFYYFVLFSVLFTLLL